MAHSGRVGTRREAGSALTLRCAPPRARRSVWASGPERPQGGAVLSLDFCLSWPCWSRLTLMRKARPAPSRVECRHDRADAGHDTLAVRRLQPVHDHAGARSELGLQFQLRTRRQSFCLHDTAVAAAFVREPVLASWPRREGARRVAGNYMRCAGNNRRQVTTKCNKVQSRAGSSANLIDA